MTKKYIKNQTIFEIENDKKKCSNDNCAYEKKHTKYGSQHMYSGQCIFGNSWVLC